MRTKILTLIADLGWLWVLLHFGLGGWENAVMLLTRYGALPWLVLGGVLFLLLFRSDYRRDVPLFIAGCLLGYWGEWWGTTRGVWAYWNGATPPAYLPPLWGIGLITVNRLASLWLGARSPGRSPQPAGEARWPACRVAQLALMIGLPLAAFAASWTRLSQVDWRGRLDAHFIAGLLAAALLIGWRFEPGQAWRLFLAGTLLGGLYEFLGTTWGEWRYITGETPPLWIAPLWGYAAVAMTRLATGLRWLTSQALSGRPERGSARLPER